MPNKPIRREPVANPIIMVNRPIRDSMVDRAEAYNFANHKTGAGQLSLRKSGMLRMALVPARTKAIICKKGVHIPRIKFKSNGIKSFITKLIRGLTPFQ